MVSTATSRTTAGFALSGLGRVAVHTTVGMLLCKERKLGLVVVGAAQVSWPEGRFPGHGRIVSRPVR